MSTPPRRRLSAEIWIVLGLSLGASALSSILTLTRRLLNEQPLGQQTATMHQPRDSEPWWDLTLQLVSIALALVPVALVLYLLLIHPGRPFHTLGLTRDRWGRSIAEGLGLAALIGLPGLAFYLVGRELGITVDVVAADLNAHWWTVPVLVLSAVRAGLLEEIIVVGYLANRLKELRWGVPAILVASALLRGSYHLYQGIGPGIGNVVMGLVFAYFYLRTGRLWPLIIAHVVIDIVAFVGYQHFAGALGLT